MARPIGNHIIAHRHRINLGAAGSTVKATTELPYPATIVEIHYQMTAASANNVILAWDLFLANDQGTTETPLTGRKLSSYNRAGATPPDPAVDMSEALSTFVPEQLYTFRTHIPVPGPEHFLKTRLAQNTATGGQLWCWFTLELLNEPEGDPSTDIRPRGTEEEPVCVRLCPPEAPPPVAPPTPPEEPLAEELRRRRLTDPLADPLPPPCDVNPEEPLGPLFDSCRVP